MSDRWGRCSSRAVLPTRYAALVCSLRRSALLLSLLPLALACPSKPTDGTTSPSPTPAPASPAPPSASSANHVDVSRIFVAQLEDGRWRVEHAMPSMPEPVRAQLQGEVDGITHELDPASLGKDAPFTKGEAVVLVTPTGTVEAHVTGLGGWLGGGNDWLVAVLDAPAPTPAPEPSQALAVFGPPPHPSARIQVIPTVPLGPRVGPVLEAAAAELPKLKAEFDGEFEPEELVELLADVRVGPECAKTFAPALAPGFAQFLVVHCGPREEAPEGAAVIAVPDPSLSGVVVLGDRPQVLHPWSLHAWSLELRAVVDLDGDGIDELWTAASGHEWWSTSLWRWDGERYVEEELGSDSL